MTLSQEEGTPRVAARAIRSVPLRFSRLSPRRAVACRSPAGGGSPSRHRRLSVARGAGKGGKPLQQEPRHRSDAGRRVSLADPAAIPARLFWSRIRRRSASPPPQDGRPPDSGFPGAESPSQAPRTRPPADLAFTRAGRIPDGLCRSHFPAPFGAGCRSGRRWDFKPLTALTTTAWLPTGWRVSNPPEPVRVRG